MPSRSAADGVITPTLAAALLALLLPLTAVAQSTQPVAVDPSTPKGALKSLAMALDHGDAEAIHHLIDANTPVQTRMVGVISDMAVALADLNRTMVSQFGQPQAESVLGNTADQLKQSLANIDSASETDTGDTATVSIAPTADGTKSLKRIDGIWKISLTELAQQRTPQQMDDYVSMVSADIRGIRDLTAEVRAGKYATAADAAAALHSRMGPTAAPSPSTAPATSQPAPR